MALVGNRRPCKSLLHRFKNVYFRAESLHVVFWYSFITVLWLKRADTWWDDISTISWQWNPCLGQSDQINPWNVCFDLALLLWDTRIDKFRILWSPWATHRKVWHTTAVWIAILCHTFLCVAQGDQSMRNSSLQQALLWKADMNCHWPQQL